MGSGKPITGKSDGVSMAFGLNRLRDQQFLYWRLPWLVISLALVTVALLGALVQRPASDPFASAADSVPTWLLNPIELNAHLRLPFTGVDLSSITSWADGPNVWTVGGTAPS